MCQFNFLNNGVRVNSRKCVINLYILKLKQITSMEYFKSLTLLVPRLVNFVDAQKFSK